MGRTRFYAAFLMSVFAARTAAAADYSWCVDATASLSSFECPSGDSCSGPAVVSLSAALEQARGAGGPDDSHTVCVATPGVHEEDFVLDGSDGSLGEGVAIEFASSNAGWCPGSAGSAGIDFLGEPGRLPQTQFSVSGLSMDFDDCILAPASLMRVGDAALDVNGVRLSDFPGDLVEVVSSTEQPQVALFQSRAERFEGAVVRGQASFFLDDSEVSGFRPPNGRALVDLEPGSFNLNATYSALFGNGTFEAPLIRFPNTARMLHVTIAGNVLGGGAPVISWEATPFSEAVLSSGSFSRNRFVEGPDFVASAAVVPDSNGESGLGRCLPTGADGDWYFDRMPASSTSTGGEGVLLELISAPGAAPVLTMSRNSVVQNNGVGGAVLRLGADLGGANVALLHNTFSAPFDLVVDDRSTQGSASLVLARNLYVDALDVSLTQRWSRVEVTLEGGAVSPPTWTDRLASLDSVLVGPFLVASPEFLPGDSIDALDSCELLELSCPDFFGDCVAGGPGPGFIEQSCSLDAARFYHPSAEFNATTAVRWPWLGPFLPPMPDGSAENRLGATGWICNAAIAVRDGDGDGSTELTDCRDGASSEVPEVPDPNGFDEESCLDSDEDCWRCPEGSDLVPPQGDDDDDLGGDDDDSGGELVGPEVDEVYTACLGCGVPLGGRGADWLAALPLVWLFGRRRSRYLDQ